MTRPLILLQAFLCLAKTLLRARPADAVYGTDRVMVAGTFPHGFGDSLLQETRLSVGIRESQMPALALVYAHSHLSSMCRMFCERASKRPYPYDTLGRLVLVKRPLLRRAPVRLPAYRQQSAVRGMIVVWRAHNSLTTTFLILPLGLRAWYRRCPERLHGPFAAGPRAVCALRQRFPAAVSGGALARGSPPWRRACVLSGGTPVGLIHRVYFCAMSSLPRRGGARRRMCRMAVLTDTLFRTGCPRGSSAHVLLRLLGCRSALCALHK